MRNKSEIGLVTRILLYALLIVFAALTIYPIYWVIINSFKTTQAFQLGRLGLPRNSR